MADNVTLPVTGTGDATPVIAADDIGGVKIQRVKIVEGADGVNDGDISSANPLPVDTELPAAAALGDAMANPTTSLVGAVLVAYDHAGSQFVRVRSSRSGSSGSIPINEALAASLQLDYYGVGSYMAHSAVGDGISASTVLASAGYQYTSPAASPVLPRTPGIFKAVDVAVTAGAPQAIWTPGSSKKFRLMGFALTLSAATSLILLDNTTELGRWDLLASSPLSPPSLGNGKLSAAANNALKADVDVTATVRGMVWGTEE